MIRRPPELEIRQKLTTEDGIDKRMAVETRCKEQSEHAAVGTPVRSRVEKNMAHTVMAATETFKFSDDDESPTPEILPIRIPYFL